MIIRTVGFIAALAVVSGALTTAAGAQSASPAPVPKKVKITYQCSNLKVVAYYDNVKNHVAFVYAGKHFVLPHVPSADGARYEGKGLEWWEKGQNVTLSSVPAGSTMGDTVSPTARPQRRSSGSLTPQRCVDRRAQTLHAVSRIRPALMINGGTKRNVLRPAALMISPKSSARGRSRRRVAVLHRQPQHQAVSRAAARRPSGHWCAIARNSLRSRRADRFDVGVEIEHVADREVFERRGGRNRRAAERRAVVAGLEARRRVAAHEQRADRQTVGQALSPA